MAKSLLHNIMAKDNTIVINNFQAGMAPSAYLGFEELRGINITDKPGAAYPNSATAKDSGSTIDEAYIQEITEDSAGNQWGHDGGGQNVYKRTAQDTWSKFTPGGSNHTASNIKGIHYWKGYVAVIFDATIDWYDITDDSCDTSWAR